MFDAIAHNANYFTASHAQDTAERNTASGAEGLKDEKHEETTQRTAAPAEQQETHPDGHQKDSLELSREAQELSELKARDREVRAHEAAHAGAGGAHAGAPSYEYQRGPDGKSYAVGGEVSIDVSPVAGDPEATLQKARQVRAAALAPAEPSAQDMKVAQRAQAMAAEAQTQISKMRSEATGEAVPASTATPGAAGVDADAALEPPEEKPVAAGSAASIDRLSYYA